MVIVPLLLTSLLWNAADMVWGGYIISNQYLQLPPPPNTTVLVSQRVIRRLNYLYHYAALDEVIKSYSVRACTVKFPHQSGVEERREAVPKGRDSSLKLILIN